MKVPEDISNQDSKTWAVADRWGDLSDSGFTVVPNTLIKAQSKLDISANDLVVILNMAMHWWSREDLPYLRNSIVAKRSGLSVRTVQRSLSKLQHKGYVTRKNLDGKTYLDPSGLREALEKISKEFSWAAEKTKTGRPARNGGTAGVQSDGRSSVI